MFLVSLFTLVLKIRDRLPGVADARRHLAGPPATAWVAQRQLRSAEDSGRPVAVRSTERSAKGWRRWIVERLIRLELSHGLMGYRWGYRVGGNSRWGRAIRKLWMKLLGRLVRVAHKRGLLHYIYIGRTHFEALVLLHEHHAIRLDVLANLLEVSIDHARRLVEDCLYLGFVEQRRFLAHEFYPWAWLTRSGSQVLGYRRLTNAPRLVLLERYFALAKIRGSLVGRLSGLSWQWVVQDLRLGRGLTGRAIPDALLEVDGRENAIIVLLTPRPRPRLERTLAELCSAYPEVSCFCSERTLSVVRRVQQELGLDNLSVFDAPSLLSEGD